MKQTLLLALFATTLLTAGCPANPGVAPDVPITVNTTSSNPATAGQDVMLTATVMASDSFAAEDTVTFFDGNTQIGSTQFGGASGSTTATVPLTVKLSQGPHSITAKYSGRRGTGTSAAFSLSANAN